MNEYATEWKRYARYWEQNARRNTDLLRDVAHAVKKISRLIEAHETDRAHVELGNLKQIIDKQTRPRNLKTEPEQ